MKKEATHVRISCLMLLALCLWLLPATVGAAPGDKKVNVDFKSVPVKTVLDAIQKQAGLNFVYSSQLAATWPKVSITAKQEPAVQVIERLTDMINCSYKINGDVVSISQQQKSGRERTVKGIVRDSDGEPLVGVPICIGESRVCTVTDADGFYTFPIPVEQTVLKYTYVGMETAYVTIAKGERDVTRDVVMQSDTRLEEVVVTGYQDISKPKMTGSVTTISADKLTSRYTSNVMSNLEGRVAGLSTYGGEMKIRGTSSLHATTTPLLVVDGIPIEGSIDDLNPYDIENITVLKDAAATAIYGARASNGIIVVTTKNANKNNKIDVDFSANLTIYDKRNLDYADNFYMTPEQQVNAESAYWNYVYFDNHGDFEDPSAYTNQNIMMGYVVTPIQYGYYQLANGLISQTQLDGLLGNLRNNNFGKDFSKHILKNQMLQQYNLSLRTRSEKSQHNITLNYKYDNTGMINSGSNAFNVNYKGVYDIAKWLRATISINGIFERNKEVNSSAAADPFNVPAYYSMFNNDGTTAWTNNQYGNVYCDEMEDDVKLKTMKFNHYDEIYNDTKKTRRQHLRYHGDLLFKIIDGLTLNTQFIYESDIKKSSALSTEDSYVSRLLRNTYTIYDYDAGYYSYLIPERGGKLATIETTGDYWTARAQLNYDKTFGKHAINVLAGLEFRETLTRGTKGLLLGYDDQMQNSSTQVVDFYSISNYEYSPYLYNGGIYATDIYDLYIRNAIGTVLEQKHRYGSGYANFTYTYDEKYNVFASIRKDYADMYGLNAKYRGKPLWSVGVAWNMDRENFMSNLSWVNFLKLRFSYGETGNIYQGATSYMTATTTDMNYVTQVPASYIESPANPYLKWEKTQTSNLGVDFAFFNNRLRGAIDWYHKVGKDIFSNKTLDPSHGFTSMFVNMANMKNDGIEISLTYDWLHAKDRQGLTWSTSLTGAYNKNKITYVENAATTAISTIFNQYVEGYPTSALWSFRYAGMSDYGKVLWYGNDGAPVEMAFGEDPSVLTYSGQSEPRINLGMSNQFSWNGFSLGFTMVYYGGHKMRALIKNEASQFPTTAIASYFADAWTPEHKTDNPSLGEWAPSATSIEPQYGDNAIYPADFLKIRNVILGYELPASILRGWGINRFSLRFQIDNPKYLWIKNDMHVDPETLGVRNPTSYMFGININI